MPPPLYAYSYVLMWLFIFVVIPAAAFTTPIANRVNVNAWSGRNPNVVSLHATTHRNILVLSHNVTQDVADGFFDINNLLHGRVDVLARCVNSALWVSNGIRQDTSVFLMLFPHNMTIEIQGWAVSRLNPDERTMALYLQRTLLIGDNEIDGLTATASEEDNSSNNSLKRRELELFRLRETKREKPDTINPFKPGSLPKSETFRLHLARKQREAMVRRINRAILGDDVPLGFVLHQNDSLEARLQQFSATGPVLMFEEHGEPLLDVLQLECQKTDDSMSSSSTTTLILGDQIGYSANDKKCIVESDCGVRQVSLGSLSLLTSQCITISHHYLDNAL